MELLKIRIFLYFWILDWKLGLEHIYCGCGQVIETPLVVNKIRRKEGKGAAIYNQKLYFPLRGNISNISRKYNLQFSLDIALSVNEIRLTAKQYCLPRLPKMFGKWKQFWVMEFVVKRSSNKGGNSKAGKTWHFIDSTLRLSNLVSLKSNFGKQFEERSFTNTQKCYSYFRCASISRIRSGDWVSES